MSTAKRGGLMPPERDLPLDPIWPDEETYVHSLLSFATGSELFRNLCGGVHILDFLTRQPDLYVTVLPQAWREWFDEVEVHDVLQLLLREDIDALVSIEQTSWRNGAFPPQSLLEYVLTIRRHCLNRTNIFARTKEEAKPMPRHLAAGMKPKKIHEVQQFSAFVDRLSGLVAEEMGEPFTGLVDFGSGQNYLGRTLASPIYDRDVIAIERKHHNVAGARRKDVHAKLAKREKIMRNKKLYKRQMEEPATNGDISIARTNSFVHHNSDKIASGGRNGIDLKGSITYIEHDIEDGRIEDIINPSDHAQDLSSESSPASHGFLTQISSSCSIEEPSKNHNLLVISLHSCGNLSHHGLRTLTPSLNPSVSAVALIGCCYNLMTERLGPTTYKHPLLRPRHPRLEATGSAHDPHGFPMSSRLETFRNPDKSPGVRLNITARMMAVQAPYNWGTDDSEAFFTRHFYRALLQKVLMDVGVVKQSSNPVPQSIVGGSISGRDEVGAPLIVGSLPKAAFLSFSTYVQAALAKLAQDPDIGDIVKSKSSTLTQELIKSYEVRFAYARKQLSIMWSLMAFSAGVVESVIVVDRWLWLKEQAGWVGKCWVQTVFDYKWSPRNLVVVGVRQSRKKHTEEERKSALGEQMGQ